MRNLIVLLAALCISISASAVQLDALATYGQQELSDPQSAYPRHKHFGAILRIEKKFEAQVILSNSTNKIFSISYHKKFYPSFGPFFNLGFGYITFPIWYSSASKLNLNFDVGIESSLGNSLYIRAFHKSLHRFWGSSQNGYGVLMLAIGARI